MASKASGEKKLKGLVVDSVKTCQAVQKGLLSRYGVETQVVENGKEAVDLFASGAKFDIVMIDISLPVLDGLEATRQIRAMGMRCKIVGIAAYGYEEERRAFFDAGADEFFEKPVPPQQLLRILAEIGNN
ncbi:two-component response regulator 24-like [Actinidia eriantha]|uniref:two-component response regulator 24-like n=1 Tax=Actinidia eriantha TaxID=165200 RepID=UPI0025905822|nr:two-component response regulator 24-like [Actinidia eriantha]